MERNIEEIWETYKSLLGRISDHNINLMLSEMEQRIVECTYNTNKDEKYVGPGGFIEFSLDLAKTMRDLNKALDLNCSIKSIFISSLLCDIGLIGDLENSTYELQDSDWHREKLGQLYKWNENCPKATVSHKTLFLLQHYKIALEKDEWMSILLSNSTNVEENKFYYSEKKGLVYLLKVAKEHILNNN